MKLMTHLPTLLLAAVSAAASAEPPTHGERLASACQACHGPEGRGSPPVPPLYGRDDIREQLETFKASAEAAGAAHLMIRFARGLSEADIEAVAAFYAQQDTP